MYAVAAGMESDSDSQSEDIVFSSKSDKSSEKKSTPYHAYHNSNNSAGRSFQRENEKKIDRHGMVPSAVMRKNYQPRNAFTRQRVHRNRTLIFDDLRYAIMQGNLENTKNLYESNGIKIDTILKSGWTGLMYACSLGYVDIVEYLLKRGADPNFHQDMFTSLMAVCISKKDEDCLLKCCLLLLQYEATVNVHDRHRTTPLIFAAREGHVNIVRILLEHNADPNDSDNRGFTPLAWAAFFGHGQVIRVLLEKGADRQKVNNMGQLPADIAYDQGFTEVASILQKIQALESEESLNTLATSLPDSNNKKTTLNSFTNRSSQIAKKFKDLDLFLLGIGCQDLIETFCEHQLTFHDLLIMDDTDLEKIGVYQAGVRKKIVEACQAVHKTEWKNSSLPNLKRNNFISCPDAVNMIGNISKHMRYICTSVIYIRNQIQSQPRILEISKDAANVHNLIDEIEDSLKNLHSLKDEMRFLKMHLIKVQNNPEFTAGDLIVETVSRERYTKTIFSAVGITTVSVILAGIWWKYPGLLNNLQPALFIRIPFLN